MQTAVHVSYTEYDAAIAAAALRKAAEGCHASAEFIVVAGGLEGHTEEQLRGLCALFLVDV
jgi:hypothetical protein